MKIDFPIKHIEGNLIFTHENTVWAYYRIDGFNYDFLNDDDKIVPFQQQMSFLTNVGLDIHFLSIPNPTDISSILDNTVEEMKRKNYPLKEYGIEFVKRVKEALENQKELNESSEYHDYIGIQLNKERNRYVSGNMGINALNAVKSFISGFNSPLYQAMGLYPDDILESEIHSYRSQANTIETILVNAFSCRITKLDTVEAIYIAEKMFSTRNNNSDISLRHDFVSGQAVEGVDKKGVKYKAIRTTKKDFIDLQGTNIEEVSPKELLLSRITKDNEMEELYAQYLVISDMGDVHYHPGYEWLYYIKLRMPFPVTVSIRADHQPNDMVRKRLGNAKLEIQDQRKEAWKGGQGVDLSVDVSEKGTVQMENYFKQTGYPGYACSFVLKVTAEDQEQLKTRVDLLVNEMSKFGLKVISPYGHQLPLLLETIPGSKKLYEDYKIEVSPGILAGMMFGATTNIGDNRGFYIGHTSRLSKPVFVQPDLAAKAYEGLGNVVDSISVLVAGMTGKGKSFFMNLFTYLSALTGSKGLIIDPKGDRKDWDKGLPFIPPEYISVWTLGTDPRDAGSLDPFRTSTSIEEAKDITMDILSYLARINIEDDEYSILSEVVEKVTEHDDPCIGVALTHLEQLHKERPEEMSDKRYEALERLLNTLMTLRRNQLSMLLFGEVGQNYKVLEHGKPIQVLMIQNLNLPSGSDVEQKRPIHMISEAIMISITAWTKQYMFNSERGVHKFILQDEASAIERSPVGAELMDFIVRMGRYYNTTLMKGSQNASDHGQDVANMGMKFSFGLRKTSECEEMLDYLNLPRTPDNIETLKRLDRGEALFQDIYGRSAVIRINPVFEELLNAFDSSTSSEEERERERERV
ncbi:ATP-binding protein [Bacillus badius]|uniref:ATP-binding protein n=1 Tax=Bacillus badius TaxID=1455 RepID=UPI000597DCBB|nr:ATP-binding protein [Bacillus badius]KIL74705.1 hypothetical protein SD78_1774 [Bacillus badius]